MATTTTKTWFITGATRGLGLELAQAVLANGDNLVATGRSFDKLKSTFPRNTNTLLLELDVCSEEQAEVAAQAAYEHFGRIDVLVNNAGYGQLGVFEEISQQDVRQQFNTNVFGLMSVTRAVLPFMRRERQGQIFNLSSIGGAIGYEAASVYCATKFAVEGFSESIAKEVKPFGISVTIIEPGFFRTDFLDSGSVRFGNHSIADYESQTKAAEETYQGYNHKQPGDPAKLAEAMLYLAALNERPVRFAAGSDAIDYLSDAYMGRQKELANWAHLSVTTDFSDSLAEAEV